MQTSRIPVSLLLALFGITATSDALALQDDGALSPLTLPDRLEDINCTDDETARWQAAVNETNGVEVEDPLGSDIGWAAAAKTSASIPTWAENVLKIFLGVPPVFLATSQWNWVPITGRKETICGMLDRQEFYRGGMGDYDQEEDNTLYIIPSSPTSATLFGQGLDGADFGSNGVHDCRGESNNCMEAEITLPRAARGTYELPTTSQSTLENQRVCAFGPYVREAVHGRRPEIHPAQAFWWRLSEPLGNNSPVAILAAGDASERFDSSDDFSLNRGDNWRPWAARPILTSFRVAFSTPVSTSQPAQMVVLHDSYEAVEIVSRPELAQRGPLRVAWRGSTVFRVTDLSPELTGARLENVCYAGSDRIRGFLRINTAVGRSNSEGFHRLIVHTIQSPPGTLRMSSQAIRLSFHPEQIVVRGRSPEGAATLSYESRPSRRPDFQFITINGTRRNLRWTPTTNGRWSAAVGVVPAGANASLLQPNAQTYRLFVPDVATDMIVSPNPIGLGPSAGEPTWGVDLRELPRPLRVATVRQWRIAAVPYFVARMPHEVRSEDENVFVEELNDKMGRCLVGASGSVDCRGLGSFAPTRFEWTTNSRGVRIRTVRRRAMPNVPIGVVDVDPRTRGERSITLTIYDVGGNPTSTVIQLPAEIITADSREHLMAGMLEWLTNRRTGPMEAEILVASADLQITPIELQSILRAR